MATVNLNTLEMWYIDGDSENIGKIRVRQPTTIRFMVRMIHTTESLMETQRLAILVGFEDKLLFLHTVRSEALRNYGLSRHA